MENKIIEFKYVSGISMLALERNINHSIKNGWQPWKIVTKVIDNPHSGSYFQQSMVKYASPAQTVVVLSADDLHRDPKDVAEITRLYGILDKSAQQIRHLETKLENAESAMRHYEAVAQAHLTNFLKAKAALDQIEQDMHI